MVDSFEESLISNLIQMIKYVYKPALESLLFFADEGYEKNRIYEEILMALCSLYSSLKGCYDQNISYIDNRCIR